VLLKLVVFARELWLWRRACAWFVDIDSILFRSCYFSNISNYVTQLGLLLTISYISGIYLIWSDI